MAAVKRLGAGRWRQFASEQTLVGRLVHGVRGATWMCQTEIATVLAGVDTRRSLSSVRRRCRRRRLGVIAVCWCLCHLSASVYRTCPQPSLSQSLSLSLVVSSVTFITIIVSFDSNCLLLTNVDDTSAICIAIKCTYCSFTYIRWA